MIKSCVKISGTRQSRKTKEEACRSPLSAILLGRSQPGSLCGPPDNLEQVSAYAARCKEGRIQNFVAGDSQGHKCKDRQMFVPQYVKYVQRNLQALGAHLIHML